MSAVPILYRENIGVGTEHIRNAGVLQTVELISVGHLQSLPDMMMPKVSERFLTLSFGRERSCR